MRLVYNQVLLLGQIVLLGKGGCQITINHEDQDEMEE